MNIRTEIWNGHEIRFIEKGGEWWAVAADVCAVLDLKQVTRALSGLPKDGVTISKVVSKTTNQYGVTTEQEVDVNTINEKSIYRLVFKSRKKEAQDFQDWVCDVIKTLRQAAGLEGFEVFRILDREHQKEAMKRLRDGLREPVKVDYIKANTIADKAVSNLFGYPKMLKKWQMPPDMLTKRQAVLDDTVGLMAVNESFRLNLSVSAAVYSKYNSIAVGQGRVA